MPCLNAGAFQEGGDITKLVGYKIIKKKNRRKK